MSSQNTENNNAAQEAGNKSSTASLPTGFQSFARRLKFLDYAAYVIIFFAVVAAITRHS